MQHCAVVDFETEAIRSRPDYPPRPVGVALKEPGQKPRYLAWGHIAGGNNTTLAQARAELKALWRGAGKVPLLLHNGKFDLEVAATHLGLPLPPWHDWHDTLFLAYLENPHAQNLELKALAAEHLSLPPTERDDLHKWIVDNVPEAKKKKKRLGEYYSLAPAGLVGRYAVGDVVRTEKLARKLWGAGVQMAAAYERERRLTPILIENERKGIRVDTRALAADDEKYTRLLSQCDDAIREILGAPDLNVDSDPQLAAAIDAADLARTWKMTKQGKRSISRKALDLADSHLTALLRYRGAVSTCLTTFVRPWLLVAQRTDGTVYTNWNQVRQPADGVRKGGTRTGRLSSSPNFQNVPKEFRPIAGLEGVPAPPMMRRYIVPPDKRSVIIHRDYNQQELRICGHFEKGALFEFYQTTPRGDIHTKVQTSINDNLRAFGTALQIDRGVAKVYDFGMLYGMGIAALAAQAGIDEDTARKIRRAHTQLLPEVGDLNADLKRMGAAGEPIFTWGGRRYHCEPPAFSEKFQREMTFEYKLLNYLIQGSAADCTKEAIVRYHADPKRRGQFLLTVHDELDGYAEASALRHEMAVLRANMESIEFDLPMLSDAKWSNKSWGEMQAFKEEQ
jgi:DNA polymerase I